MDWIEFLDNKCENILNNSFIDAKLSMMDGRKRIRYIKALNKVADKHNNLIKKR